MQNTNKNPSAKDALLQLKLKRLQTQNPHEVKKETMPDSLPESNNKQVTQLLRLLRKNYVIKENTSLPFFNELFNEISDININSIYNFYNDLEIMQLKNKLK